MISCRNQIANAGEAPEAEGMKQRAVHIQSKRESFSSRATLKSIVDESLFRIGRTERDDS